MDTAVQEGAKVFQVGIRDHPYNYVSAHFQAFPDPPTMSA